MDRFVVLKKKKRVVLLVLRHSETHSLYSEYENFLCGLTYGFSKSEKAAKFFKKKKEKLLKKGFKVFVDRITHQL